MPGRVEFRILGPLEASEDGRVCPLGGAKQRALAAILLLHANEVVSTDRLIDELWGEQPPATANHVIQVYVSQLRKTLGNGGDGARLLVTKAPGYMIALDQGQLDLLRFEHLVADARRVRDEGDPATASAMLAEALALWHGPPLADFAYEPFAQTAIARLEKLRVTATEDRIDCELALGRHANVVGELESLVAQHPLRERLRSQLMLALYRSGRQAEALDAYQAARRTLDAELGIEPSPALRELEQEILNQDPALAAPPAPASSGGAVAARRGTWVVAVAIVLLAAAGIVAGLLLSRGGNELSRLPPNSVGRIDPETERIVGATAVGSGPTLIAAGEGGIWVANFDDQTISHLDPATGKEVRRIAADGTPTGLAAGMGGVWVTHEFEGTLSRINPALDTIVETVELGTGVGNVAVGVGSVWVVNGLAEAVLRIDPGTNDLVATYAVGGSPDGIAAGGGAVWVTDGAAVVRIDPATNEPERIALRHEASRIAVGTGAVWVSSGTSDSVTRIDLASRSAVAVIDVGDEPKGIAVDAGSVWVANALDGTVSRIDAATNEVTGTIVVGNAPDGLAVDRGLVWVTAPAP